MTPHAFTVAVGYYCLLTRASVTSWWRSRARNAQVGGVQASPHLVGQGVDVVYDGAAPPDDGPELAERLGLRLLREADHDHLQPLDWRA